MKKIITSLLLIFCFIATTHSQEKLPIKLSKSTIKWIAEYTFYFGGHEGYINFKKGYLIKTDNKITGGKFIVNMNTISNTDIDKKDANESLVNHLKDPDFFDVKKFPIAELEFTKVEYESSTKMRIKANLSIKKIKLPINFSATANYDEATLSTKFKIDRTRWGINYNSKIKDGAISDAIGFIVKLAL